MFQRCNVGEKPSPVFANTFQYGAPLGSHTRAENEVSPVCTRSRSWSPSMSTRLQCRYAASDSAVKKPSERPLGGTRHVVGEVMKPESVPRNSFQYGDPLESHTYPVAVSAVWTRSRWPSWSR